LELGGEDLIDPRRVPDRLIPLVHRELVRGDQAPDRLEHRAAIPGAIELAENHTVQSIQLDAAAAEAGDPAASLRLQPGQGACDRPLAGAAREPGRLDVEVDQLREEAAEQATGQETGTVVPVGDPSARLAEAGSNPFP